LFGDAYSFQKQVIGVRGIIGSAVGDHPVNALSVVATKLLPVALGNECAARNRFESTGAAVKLKGLSDRFTGKATLVFKTGG
jgi:hypothetical protein